MASLLLPSTISSALLESTRRRREMDHQIDEWLRLKRIAVVGFETPEAKTIVEGLRIRGLNARALDLSDALPGLNPLLPFDACVVSGTISGAMALSPQTLHLIGRKPNVIICDEAVPTDRALQDLEAIRDFAIRPINFDELLIRIAKVAR